MNTTEPQTAVKRAERTGVCEQCGSTAPRKKLITAGPFLLCRSCARRSGIES